jgi:Retrotransposon gag protein
MGQLPPVFHGDRTRAEDFIEKLKAYVHVNDGISGFSSARHRIALALTLIEGPQVAGWARDMGAWYDLLTPAHDTPQLWEQFLKEFTNQFQDMQSSERAQTKLQSFKMKAPYVDQYISEFETLARQAGYMSGDQAVTRLFLNGLPPNILRDLLKTGIPTTNYEALKQKAVDLTTANQLIEAIINQSGTPPRFPPNRGNWQPGRPPNAF